MKTAWCHWKLQYVPKFTAASRGTPCDSTAFLFTLSHSLSVVNRYNFAYYVTVLSKFRYFRKYYFGNVRLFSDEAQPIRMHVWGHLQCIPATSTTRFKGNVVIVFVVLGRSEYRYKSLIASKREGRTRQIMMMDSNIFGISVPDVYIHRPVLRDISDSPLGRGMQIHVYASVTTPPTLYCTKKSPILELSF